MLANSRNCGILPNNKFLTTILWWPFNAIQQSTSLFLHNSYPESVKLSNQVETLKTIPSTPDPPSANDFATKMRLRFICPGLPQISIL